MRAGPTRLQNNPPRAAPASSRVAPAAALSPCSLRARAAPLSAPNRTGGAPIRRRRSDTATMSAGADATPALANTKPTPEVLEIWRNADAVCFDVDSTFCEDESIDEIAAFLGVGEEVAAMTTRAMGGSVRFEDALAARLGVMRPSRAQLDAFLQGHPPRLSPGIPELVKALQSQGKGVFLVSGGFRAVIHPIAESLGIPRGNVYANRILFDDATGEYAGFDRDEFTSRSGGKPAAIRDIRAKHGVSRVVMVGDGATDLEARKEEGAACLFVGYGGVVVRGNIAAAADWYVMRIEDLTEALLVAEGGGEAA